MIDYVNKEYFESLEDIKIRIQMDEMWSFVQSKGNQRWLWLAIDYRTHDILAYTFGRRKDEIFLEFKKISEPFGITKFYSADWGAYSRYLDASYH